MKILSAISASVERFQGKSDSNPKKAQRYNKNSPDVSGLDTLRCKKGNDNIYQFRVIITGSSAFDLMNNLGEPLTGRMNDVNLYPFSQAEYK